MMKFVAYHGRVDKVQPYMNALLAAGHQLTLDWKEADFVLNDFDRPRHRETLWQIQRERGTPIFVYPHAALSMMSWDGIYDTDLPIRVHFTLGEGQREVMRRYGYPHRTVATGWGWSPVKKMAFVEKPKSILFAPKHPNAHGDVKLAKIDQTHNRYALLSLLELNIPITVYYGHKLEDNGLAKTQKHVTWIKSTLKLADTIRMCQKFDAVIAHDTFAYTSIALGKQTYMYNDAPQHNIGERTVKSWDLYKDYLEYPLTFKYLDPEASFYSAPFKQKAVEKWREKFIGGRFNVELFVSTIEQEVKAPSV